MEHDDGSRHSFRLPNHLYRWIRRISNNQLSICQVCSPDGLDLPTHGKLESGCGQILSQPGFEIDGPIMTLHSDETEELLRRAEGGDQKALADLFDRHHERLGHMVRLRMDRRLQGRLDPSDVLQEAYLDCSRRLTEYVAKPQMSFFLWLRFLTGQRLIDLHRQHLGAKMRDAGQEVSLYRGALPQASSVSLAAHLLGRLTSASRAAIRAETQIRVQEALEYDGPDGPRSAGASPFRDVDQRRDGAGAGSEEDGGEQSLHSPPEKVEGNRDKYPRPG